MRLTTIHTLSRPRPHLILILAFITIEFATPRSGTHTAPPQHDRIVDRVGGDSIWNHPLYRVLCRHLPKNQRCSAVVGRNTNRWLQGTRLSLRFPTTDRVGTWYSRNYYQIHPSPRDDRDHTCDNDALTTICNRRKCVFNHELVGMTNPSLQIQSERPLFPITDVALNSSVPPAVSSQDDRSGTANISSTRKWSRVTSLMQRYRDHPSSGRFRGVLPSMGSSPSVTPMSFSDLWWPGMTHSPNKDWRILRFRQRVGKGRECYERCRDAALAWEFRGEGQGIVLVEEPSVQYKATGSPCSRREKRHANILRKIMSCSLNARSNHEDENHHDSQRAALQRIRTGPGRRFVTYTSIPKRGGWIIPHVYTVNPVAVVYDVIDQRALGTTYTATAYATQAGHLLCGEERVLVCHRDHDGTVDVEILSVSRAANSVPGRLVWPFIGRMQRSFFQEQLDALQGVAHGTDK